VLDLDLYIVPGTTGSYSRVPVRYSISDTTTCIDSRYYMYSRHALATVLVATTGSRSYRATVATGTTTSSTGRAG